MKKKKISDLKEDGKSVSQELLKDNNFKNKETTQEAKQQGGDSANEQTATNESAIISTPISDNNNDVNDQQSSFKNDLNSSEKTTSANLKSPSAEQTAKGTQKNVLPSQQQNQLSPPHEVVVEQQQNLKSTTNLESTSESEKLASGKPVLDHSELKKELVGKLTTLKFLSKQKGDIARVKVAVPQVRHSQVKKKEDRLIINFKDIFYSSNLLSKINLYLFMHRKAIIILLICFAFASTVSFGVGFGYFKKYTGYPGGGDFFSFPGYIPNQPTYDPSQDALFSNNSSGASLSNVFQWGQVKYDAPLQNYNGQIYYIGNSSSTAARDGLDVNEKRWGQVHRDHLLYKYTEFDGPILHFGSNMSKLSVEDFCNKYFSHQYYVKKTKTKIYPGDMQQLHDSLINHLLHFHLPIITYDDRFKIADKKQSPNQINKMTNLIFNVLQQGTIVQNSIGLPVSITGGGDDGNAYLRDAYVTWVDLNTSQGKYKKHSKLDLKKHPELANDYFSDYIKNSFSVHSTLVTQDGRLGPANVNQFPLFGILDQNAYYYPSLGSNVLARVPSAKLFACTSPLTINQLINFYYWIFSKQSDSIHDNNYWDDSNIHK